MPVLKEILKTKKVNLPNYKGSEVVVKTEKTVKETRDLNEKVKGLENEFDVLIEMLVLSIESWNFTEENGEASPINKETVGRLGNKDLEVLAEAITGKTMEELQELGTKGIDKKKD